MESFDQSVPNICNPVGPFNITIELRDGTGLTIQFSNGGIIDSKKIGDYTIADFQWMVLESPDQRSIVPRASAMPCYVCSGSGEDCRRCRGIPAEGNYDCGHFRVRVSHFETVEMIRTVLFIC